MCIHGDKSQPERDWVLNGEFKTKYCPYCFRDGHAFCKGPGSKDFLLCRLYGGLCHSRSGVMLQQKDGQEPYEKNGLAVLQ